MSSLNGWVQMSVLTLSAAVLAGCEPKKEDFDLTPKFVEGAKPEDAFCRDILNIISVSDVDKSFWRYRGRLIRDKVWAGTYVPQGAGICYLRQGSISGDRYSCVLASGLRDDRQRLREQLLEVVGQIDQCIRNIKGVGYSNNVRTRFEFLGTGSGPRDIDRRSYWADFHGVSDISVYLTEPDYRGVYRQFWNSYSLVLEFGR